VLLKEISFFLKWHAHIHIQFIQNMISKTIGMMNRVKKLTPTTHLRLL